MKKAELEARITLLEKQVQLLTRVVASEPSLLAVYTSEAPKFVDSAEAKKAKEVLKG